MFFFRWQSVVDFIVLTVAVYWLLHLGRQTRVLRMVVGIGGLLLLGFLARRLDLPFTAWLMQLAALSLCCCWCCFITLRFVTLSRILIPSPVWHGQKSSEKFQTSTRLLKPLLRWLMRIAAR
jgi:hypothetical protein